MIEKPFDKDMISIMNIILYELYGDTEYWGQLENGDVEGIIKPINSEDDLEWSNYNFINTNYSTINKVIIPYMKELFKSGKYKLKECLNFPLVNYNKGINDFKENEYNPNKSFFDLLYLMREELFGFNSEIKNDIISTINKTRNKGLRLEDYLVLSLNNCGIYSEKVSGPGKLSDFKGTDVIIGEKKGQVKSLIFIKKINDNYIIKYSGVNKIYLEQDFLIFSNEIEKDKIYEFFIFENPKNNNLFIINKKYLKYVLKYNDGEVEIKKLNN